MKVERKVTWTREEWQKIKTDALRRASVRVFGELKDGEEYEVDEREYGGASVEIVEKYIPPQDVPPLVPPAVTPEVKA